MPRFIVERTFKDGLDIPATDDGRKICAGVIRNNTEESVTWVHSYVSEDHERTFCVYDAPSADAIMRAADRNKLPVSRITQVSVLDPYFYH